MRTLTSVAAIALLACSVTACKKAEPAPEVVATDAAPAATAMAAATPAGGVAPTPGKYEATSADGKTKSMVTINADGTYRQVVNGALPVAGILKMVDGKTCFDPSGPTGPTCYTDSVHAADGSFTATMADGSVMNVKTMPK